jgi:hypothetical protein
MPPDDEDTEQKRTRSAQFGFASTPAVFRPVSLPRPPHHHTTTAIVTEHTGSTTDWRATPHRGLEERNGNNPFCAAAKVYVHQADHARTRTLERNRSSVMAATRIRWSVESFALLLYQSRFIWCRNDGSNLAFDMMTMTIRRHSPMLYGTRLLVDHWVARPAHRRPAAALSPRYRNERFGASRAAVLFVRDPLHHHGPTRPPCVIADEPDFACFANTIKRPR